MASGTMMLYIKHKKNANMPSTPAITNLTGMPKMNMMLRNIKIQSNRLYLCCTSNINNCCNIQTLAIFWIVAVAPG